jgi:predicted NUDIX family NTP pyrophosphohydrolase
MNGEEHTTVHVVPDGEDWAIEVEGDGVPTSSYSTEEDATAAARELAREEGAGLEVHGADGDVKLRDSYDVSGE